MSFSEILEPPLDVERALSEVPELALARGVEQSPYHHLDTLDHILEVVRRVEAELAEGEIGAHVSPDYLEGLRLAALLHDVAKAVTRGEYEGKAIFVAHDTLGAMMVRRICGRLSVSSVCTDIAATLTALHLKIGFMASDRTDFPPNRLVRAAGPFGEELAVLSWADRLAAQGPRLRDEHIERHKNLCRDFLAASREAGPHPAPDYEKLREEFASGRPASGRPHSGLSDSKPSDSEIGYAAARARLAASGGVGWKEALGHVRRTMHADSSPS
ncbi:MAG: HD domain-containing protein [Actinomycetota bacterium]|jgi:poly(A) polymerase|nr:HD domain-containing protein [Rubrobacter sp.]MDQ3508100.1 HD domain-containing protein [Actinomycetota bacterium]